MFSKTKHVSRTDYLRVEPTLYNTSGVSTSVRTFFQKEENLKPVFHPEPQRQE